jgi:D-aminopeptidase
MKLPHENILIIADIEGSSGCWSYAGSSFVTNQWCNACVDMTLDVNAVVGYLFDSGVKQITVKDFHRTGFNLLPEMIDPRAALVSGYKRSPVPGLGHPGNARAVMFLGMHAASGTDGFLAHTLSSRIEKLIVNGKPMAEIELFSASLAPFGIRPIFFSGCPVACRQARETIAGIDVYPIDKFKGPDDFDKQLWRKGLGQAAAESLKNNSTDAYKPPGTFSAVVHMRAGENETLRIAKRWGLRHRHNLIFVDTDDIHLLYLNLIRICYLTPAIERILPVALFLYNLWGRAGQLWIERKIKKRSLSSKADS